MAPKEKSREKEMEREKESKEFQEKVLFVNRTSKVVTGGRKFGFSALIVVGDGKGRVGYGFAKANELADSIRKGGELAKKNMHSFEMDGTTIPHEVLVKQDGALLLLKPAPEGTGVIAGSRVRAVLEAAGVRDIVAKSLGCNNPINQVRATFKALFALQNKKKHLEARRQS